MAQLYLPLTPYIEVADGDALASSIANRHYSRMWRNKSGNRFVGPGRRLILLEPSGKWLFVWRAPRYRQDGQTGVECTLFRNESEILSSEIIRLAEAVWDTKYGVSRKFTYVHPGLIRSTNPGYCFQCAGWQRTSRRSTRGLILLVREHDKLNK